MKKVLLIADSGGSKTDWCFIIDQVVKDVFTTCSYHPQNVNHQWIDEQKQFWNELLLNYDIELFFFGAGCLKEENKKMMRKAFMEIGFEKVNLDADITGAARACLGDCDGIVAILGTGSVIAEIKNHNLYSLNGGFGYLLGDEGGGYYFGKLLLKSYLNGNLETDTQAFLEHEFGNKSTILSKVYGPNGKMFISGLAELCSKVETSCIHELHRENFCTFLNLYLPNNISEKSLSVVGSYAYFNQQILQEELDRRGWRLTKICSRPIDELVKYFVKNGF
jgi:glucosamine kinase